MTDEFRGYVPLDDPDRMPTQAEVDDAGQYTVPMIRIFEKIPPEQMAGVVCSLIMTFCMKFDEPEKALKMLHDAILAAIPQIQEAVEATWQ
jgi:hypothetical protein